MPVTTQHTPNNDRMTRIHRNDVEAARQLKQLALNVSSSECDPFLDLCLRLLLWWPRWWRGGWRYEYRRGSGCMCSPGWGPSIFGAPGTMWWGGSTWEFNRSGKASWRGPETECVPELSSYVLIFVDPIGCTGAILGAGGFDIFCLAPSEVGIICSSACWSSIALIDLLWCELSPPDPGWEAPCCESLGGSCIGLAILVCVELNSNIKYMWNHQITTQFR